MAQGSASTAAAVFIRISLLLGGLAFFTGVLGFIIAAIAVHTGSVTRVDVPLYPVTGQVTPVPISRRDVEEVSPVRRPLSKLSLDL